MAEGSGLATFESVRPRLFGIAYRMIGTVSEAEDVVQEAWLRWQGTDRDAVREPAAFLATTVTRLALTALDSARARRERYVGPWLPEPVDTAGDPALGAERAEALSLAVLAAARAADARPSAPPTCCTRRSTTRTAQIAEVLEISEANARQLASRARAHLAGARAASVSRRRAASACSRRSSRPPQNGDLEALEAVLADDVVALSDGGGIVLAARKPVVGRERVAQFLLGVLEKFAPTSRTCPPQYNGGLAFVGLRDGEPIAVWTVDIGADGIRGFYNVMNPQKLSRIEAPSGHSR